MMRKLIGKVKYFFSNESCYDCRTLDGIAKDGVCGGTAGGTWETGFLSESCVCCEYFKDNVKRRDGD